MDTFIAAPGNAPSMFNVLTFIVMVCEASEGTGRIVEIDRVNVLRSMTDDKLPICVEMRLESVVMAVFVAATVGGE